jgi:tRNA (adenine57-N1/adenine58-N1)-methyltransferase catalytic subunit
LIEAGSGSGSFTHAAARAVFNGYPDPENGLEHSAEPARKKRRVGRVFSYEFHADRYEKVKEEMRQHGLDPIVTVTERDVYGKGFAITETSDSQGTSPCANAVFLDVPAPWQALPHLTRQSSTVAPSPLDPHKAVHICTFSPCVEQAQKTVSAFRRHGWIDIEMVEMQQKRIDVRREYTGLDYEGMRGVNTIAANIDEALSRLKAVEKNSRNFRAGQTQSSQPKDKKPLELERPHEGQKSMFKDGRLIHRSEPELKTHTSYLVFAILPMEWTEEDEAKARAEWTDNVDHPVQNPRSHRQLKREARQRAIGKADERSMSVEGESANPVEPSTTAGGAPDALELEIDM